MLVGGGGERLRERDAASDEVEEERVAAAPRSLDDFLLECFFSSLSCEDERLASFFKLEDSFGAPSDERPDEETLTFLSSAPTEDVEFLRNGEGV